MIFTKEATVTKTTWRDREMKPYDMWVIKYVDGSGETIKLPRKSTAL